MDQEQWNTVDGYIRGLFAPQDPVLEAALQDSAAAGLPAIQVTPNQAKLLQILARAVGARSILEIGTLGGYSTIWLGRALAPGGRLLTLEANPKHAEVARKNLERAGLSQIVEVRLGEAQQTLAQLVTQQNQPFDLVFIDADKPGYTDYLQWALKLTHPGSLIIADNVVRKGEIANPNSPDANIQAIRRFNTALAAEPRLSATIFQTVSTKGYDGMAIAVVIA